MEIKSTVTVNTTDIAARASEDSKDPKEAEKAAAAKRGGKIELLNFGCRCHLGLSILHCLILINIKMLYLCFTLFCFSMFVKLVS